MVELSGFAANPIAGQPAEGHVDPVQLKQHLPRNSTSNALAVYNAQSWSRLLVTYLMRRPMNFWGTSTAMLRVLWITTATQQDSDSTVNQPPPPPTQVQGAPAAPALLPTSNNNRNGGGVNNTVGESKKLFEQYNVDSTVHCQSKVSCRTTQPIGTIIGDVSDKKADELLDKAGGDVERAVVLLANPESTVVPAASAVASASRRRSLTSRNLVVQPNFNTNSVATASRRRSSTSRNLVVQPNTNTNSVATASHKRSLTSQNLVVQPTPIQIRLYRIPPNALRLLKMWLCNPTPIQILYLL